MPSKYRTILFLSLLLFLQCLVSPSIEAQPNIPEGSYSLRNPARTIYTHLHYLQAKHYKPAIAAKTIREGSLEEREEWVVQLKKIYAAKGLAVDWDEVPTEENHTDSTRNNKSVYVPFEELKDIYLEKKGSYWYYSGESVEKIPILYNDLYPFDLKQYTKKLPPFFHQKIIGLQVWQWIGIFVLILFSIVFHKFLKLLFRIAVHRLSDTKFGKLYIQKDLISQAGNILSLMIIVRMIIWFFPEMNFSSSVSFYLLPAIHIVFIVFCIIFAIRMVNLAEAYIDQFALKGNPVIGKQLLPLLRKLMKALAVIVGTFFILKDLEVNVTALLAGISIGGLAVALAAQDTIKNVFGSMMIFLDQPFKVGDRISFEALEGKVENVGFRSTRLRTRDNSLIYVPNARLADMTINNLGLRVYRRFESDLGVTYETPPLLILKFVKGLRKVITNHPNTHKEYYHVYLNDLDSSSITIYFNVYFKVSTWDDELHARQEIISGILELAHILGIRFAFPSQTIYVEQFPEKESLTPTYKMGDKELENRLEDFIEKYRMDIREDEDHKQTADETSIGENVEEKRK
ncbi:MAG: mechanosensitive ion channel family protein [Chitinophagales bacterium]